MPRLCFFLATLCPATAWAAETTSMTSALLRTLWALLVVTGLILALYGLAKRRLRFGPTGGSAIKIIEMRALQPKASVALVEVRGREYLLGVSGQSVHLLADLSADAGKTVPDFSSLLADQS